MGYVLYGTRNSRAFRVLWMLEELRAEYEHRPVAPRSEDLTAVSPRGKIPVLVDGDHVLPDSSAILTWLADRHSAFTFPAGSTDRARQDAWTFRILDELEGQLWTAAKHSFILPEAERVPEVKPACKAEFARNVAALAEEIEGPFLMGETMTVPDFILTHCAGWAQNAKFPDLPDRLLAYLDPIRARAAFVKAASL